MFLELNQFQIQQLSLPVVAEIDNFEFEVKIPVLKFTVVVVKPRQDAVSYICSGGSLSAQAKAAMSSLPYKSTVYIEGVQVQLPDGRTPIINSMVFTVN